MKRWIARAVLAIAAMASAPAVWSADVAVVIGNNNYQNYPSFRGAGQVLRLSTDLRNAGFTVVELRNLQSQTMADDLGTVVRDMNQADRLILVASGYFVGNQRDSWLLNVDANKPDNLSVGWQGLSVGYLYDMAARHSGMAIVAIAEDQDGVTLAQRLGDQFVANDIPQGVTLVHGAPRQVADFIANAVLTGQVLAEAAKSAPQGLRVRGYLPESEPFLLTGQPVADVTEQDVWQQALGLNTETAFRDYLRRFPNGMFAQDARARLAALTLTPQQRAERDEKALNLNRDQRRGIQNYLTILGFDTSGIDGVLGAQSRAAIADWQLAKGLPVTGYLTANQISQIETSGAQRAAELQAEADRQRREAERKDRDYWKQTGATGVEADLRAYLRRYPDGLFAQNAQNQLDKIDRQKRREAQIAEREAWDQALMQGTVPAFRKYLRDYPNGKFAEQARAEVQKLNNPETPPEVIAQAKLQEQRLGLDTQGRLNIEIRLRQLNFDPGLVDGSFDPNTRRALRQFQRANSLPVTGFVSNRTGVLLLVASTMQ